MKPQWAYFDENKDEEYPVFLNRKQRRLLEKKGHFNISEKVSINIKDANGKDVTHERMRTEKGR